MSKQAVALILGLLVAGVLVVGCGGDDDNDASAGSPGVESTSTSAGSEAEADAGEGGADDVEANAGDEGGATITKAAFIKQGNAICAASQERIADQGTKFFDRAEKTGKNEGLEFEIIESVLAPEFQTLVDHLEALGVPSGDEEEVEAMIAAFQQRADLASEDPQGFFKAEGQTGGPLTVKAETLAKEYGLKACGG